MVDKFLIKLVLFVSSRYGWLLSFLVLSTSSVCNSEICKKLTMHEILSALEDFSELYKGYFNKMLRQCVNIGQTWN